MIKIQGPLSKRQNSESRYLDQKTLDYFRQGLSLGLSFLSCKMRDWLRYKISSKSPNLTGSQYFTPKLPSPPSSLVIEPQFLTKNLGVQNKDHTFQSLLPPGMWLSYDRCAENGSNVCVVWNVPSKRRVLSFFIFSSVLWSGMQT